MSDLLTSYTSLSASSSRVQVSNVLQSIADSPPYALTPASRSELMQALLTDLKLCIKYVGNKGRLTPKDAGQALTAVKAMGKTPALSAIIATPSNLSLLLTLSTHFKDEPETSNEALRCVANALLLVDTARVTWASKDVGGGEASAELLERSSSPDQIFLSCRILFLCTASAAASSSFIRNLVETKNIGHSSNIVQIIGAKLDLLINHILGGVKMSREAMTDLLKLTFNLLCHYPKLVESEPQEIKSPTVDDKKVMGDFWSPRLDGLLPPLLRVFNSLPPTFPAPLASPLTHVIHCLITIPVNTSLHSVWFGNGSSASTPTSSRSGSSSASTSPVSAPKSPLPAGGSRSGSPPSKEGKTGAVDRALSVLAAGRRSISRSSSPLPSSRLDILRRAQDLLEVSLNHYLPGDVDPDHESVRARCKKEGDNSLDDIVSPLVVLITRFALFDEVSRRRTREWIFPADLDRTHSLEGRSDTLGRSLRLLASVYHPRLKDAMGEMLFAISNSDPSTLSALAGYGNVAGFLFNKGILSAPPPPSGDEVLQDQTDLNPITGITQQRAELEEMTEEEKEAEAEKLFVLFDRLERSGALPPNQNPIRRAAAEGRLG
ncbi:hypothetical protein PLICRDRAFT_170663 [Plicaturopsis crispa FD-325 SS-3]|nr:hypothetical protein PLICRDRAFT_170663 [Plicaturopsis crispa FD-325 SS-3]